jgi:hypothetical protein
MTPLDPIQQKQIMDLLILSLEGEAGSEDMQKLKEILDASSEARDYYLKAVIAAECIRKIDWEAKDVENETDGCEGFNTMLWKALAEEEKSAPVIEIPAPEESEIFIQKIPCQKVVRKISKSSLFTLFAAAAAIALIFVFAYFAPPNAGVDVATLTDSMNARWADTDTSMSKGTRFATGSTDFLLREGLAELTFDNDAKVTLEGPVEFQILTEDQIKLSYGRLYATVPQGAIGFTVNTSSARIIDLGTEFGIESDAHGDTYLHVMKGKTTLIAGEKSNKVSMEVIRGIAKKVSGGTQAVSDIAFRQDIFVRNINSDKNFIWKGQKELNLADIVGGGNGLGTGTINMMIDPISGKPSKESWGRREAANDYHLVPSSPYIDGVFIPNGRTKQIVSSEGHLFQECPVTSGLCCDSLINAEIMLNSLVDQNIKVSDSPTHALFLHANMGITFDLQAMRNLLPGARIVRFQSKFGIRKWTVRPSASNADFWILVDGKLRHKKTQVKANSIFDVDIELSENNRFLTLIETDGGDPEGRILDGLVLPPIDSDWGMFVDPILVLE